MIDLHLHFDGSLPVETVWEQGIKQNIDLNVTSIEELREKLSISDDCQSLNEYLEKFELPLRVLQTEEGIVTCMESLIQQLIKDNMLYAEVRFAPQLHCLEGLSQEEVVQAAMRGVKSACEHQEFKAQLILCCMRGNENQKENLETVQLTKKYLGNVVCACDLAGAEAIFRTYEFEDLFAYAKSLGIPYTIHAGEADGPESIEKALQYGARRIGHGVRCVENLELVQRLIEEGITLECCPISNLHTKAVLNMEEHPVLPLLRKGMKTTINTDNRTVSNTTINREMAEVKAASGMTKEEEKQLYLNGVAASFQTEDEKAKLVRLIELRFSSENSYK